MGIVYFEKYNPFLDYIKAMAAGANIVFPCALIIEQQSSHLLNETSDCEENDG